eukprot:scaffold11689_cov69-Cyclotella_meneghiniana.AAC.1
MKIQLILSAAVAVFQVVPCQSAGVRAKLNPPFEFDEAVKEELGESLEHGKSCRNDSACPSNTHCNTNRGTSTFHTCVNDVDNLPIEVDDDEGDKCGAYCTSDSQCMSPPGAPYNACGKCGMYSGTQMYRRCYSPETPKPTPSPTPWDYFQGGAGKCSKFCSSDSDCMNAPGAMYNPCMKCGKYSGTLMYQKCYAPNEDNEIVN